MSGYSQKALVLSIMLSVEKNRQQGNNGGVSGRDSAHAFLHNEHYPCKFGAGNLTAWLLSTIDLVMWQSLSGVYQMALYIHQGSEMMHPWLHQVIPWHCH